MSRAFQIAVRVLVLIEVDAEKNEDGVTVTRVRHIYDPTPGEVMEGIDADNEFETLDRLYESGKENA